MVNQASHKHIRLQAPITPDKHATLPEYSDVGVSAVQKLKTDTSKSRLIQYIGGNYYPNPPGKKLKTTLLLFKYAYRHPVDNVVVGTELDIAVERDLQAGTEPHRVRGVPRMET